MKLIKKTREEYYILIDKEMIKMNFFEVIDVIEQHCFLFMIICSSELELLLEDSHIYI